LDEVMYVTYNSSFYYLLHSGSAIFPADSMTGEVSTRGDAECEPATTIILQKIARNRGMMSMRKMPAAHCVAYDWFGARTS